MSLTLSEIDRRRKAVLIVECDSVTLERQNLALGEQLRASVKLAFPRNRVELVQTETEAELLRRLGEIARDGQRYRSVVIIGHSNRDGLRLTADRFYEWAAVAKWFAPFDPHRVILIACEAGRWLPCAALFEGIPDLKEIFGSPVPAHKNQIWFVLASVMYALGAKKPEGKWVAMMQAANFIITKGLMFRNTRRDYERGGVAEAEGWAKVENFLDQVMRGLGR